MLPKDTKEDRILTSPRSEMRKINYLQRIIMSMGNDEEDLLAFLQGFGFSEEELNCVLDELNAYRSIPGTTIRRYMNRVINTLIEEERTAFLKGIMLGVAIRKVADVLAEPDLTDEEKRIDHEIEKLRFSR